MSYAATSAHRATTIATIARTRAASPAPIPTADGRAALLTIADLLDTAADAFRASTPAVINGNTMNEIPSDAWYALTQAEGIAANTPATGFPATVCQYVTRRLNYDLPPNLRPDNAVAAAREGNLLARIRILNTELTTAVVPETVTSLLENAFRLLWKHALLAEVFAADANRPCNRPAIPAVAKKIRTPDTTMALRRAHDEHGPTLAYGLKDRRLACHSGDHWLTANWMVSHLGAAVPSCDEHLHTAVLAARELHTSMG
ncbi:hypothetical protein OG413_20550 [Streptomyces sp. NBC_01433]|uniref:hypothetical protein n=1 Tax=Streptomyces sp. NBC_01433 TaxID=2903864 RepID=UPI00225A6C40|nr:hypothetical protein [Streptomyces sp. NBC_01433]MCX4677665.1 hypothetical protein [Streptomyces sp. NBC_01433]